MAKKVEGTEKVDTGISNANAKKVADELNKVLADEFVLYIKTLKFHWNIEGKDFHALHVFLEEQYNDLQSIIDGVAERIRKIGNFSNGSMKQFLADCSLKEHTETATITESMISELVADHESLIRKLRLLIDDFDKKYDDMGSSDFVVGLMKKHEKMAWMLRASTR
jgi:starvation-inducible DNA-binding protein